MSALEEALQSFVHCGGQFIPSIKSIECDSFQLKHTQINLVVSSLTDSLKTGGKIHFSRTLHHFSPARYRLFGRNSGPKTFILFIYGKHFTHPRVCSLQRLGQHPRLSQRGHEIRVACPARNNVNVDVTRHACTRR